MHLIIISGPQGTGKTTLGKRLEQEFKLPFFSKDNIKEVIFDTLGWKDREFSVKVGTTAYGILYSIIDTMLKSGCSLIVESNFLAKYDSKKFIDFKEKYGVTPFEIQLHCEGNILFKRFKERSFSQDRHPGHVDTQNFEAYKEVLLKGSSESLLVGGEVYLLNTTNLEEIPYEDLSKHIKLYLDRLL